MKFSASRRSLFLCVGLFVFAWCVRYLVTAFDWNEVLGILRQASLSWLGLSALSILAYFAVRTARWLVLIRSFRCMVSFSDLYFVTALTIAISMMTPAKAGEAFKVELLRKYDMIGRVSGYGSVMIERLADLMVVLLAALLGLWLEVLPANHTASLPILAILLGVLGLGALALWGIRPGGTVGVMLGELRSAAGDWKTLTKVFFLTVLAWLVVGIGWMFSFRSIGLRVAPVELLCLVPITTLAVLLSFIPAGLGVFEVTTSVLLERMGVSSPLAQAGALILRVYGLLVISLGLIHFPVARVGHRPHHLLPESPQHDASKP